MKKCILVLLATVAVTTAMLAVSVAPSFARPPVYDCTHPETGAIALGVSPNAKHFFVKAGFECVKQ